MKLLKKVINDLVLVSSVALCGTSIYFFTVNNLADAIYLLVFATLITIAGMWVDLHGEENEFEEWILRELKMLMQIHFGKQEDDDEHKRGDKSVKSDT